MLEKVGSLEKIARGATSSRLVDSLFELAERTGGPLKQAIETGKADFVSTGHTNLALRGMFDFGTNLRRAADNFSAVLKDMRQLQPAIPNYNETAGTLSNRLISDVVKTFKEGGVATIRHSQGETGGGGFSLAFGVPLNQRFGTEALDLNRVGGLRSAVAGKPPWLTGATFDTVPFAKLNDSDTVSTWIRHNVLKWERAEKEGMVDPQFMQALRAGEEKRTPVALALKIPGTNDPWSLYTQVEETTHLFQNANGRIPLSRLGFQVLKDLDERPLSMQKLIQRKARRELIEHDYVGVLEEFGVPVPDSVMRIYNRDLISRFVRADEGIKREFDEVVAKVNKSSEPTNVDIPRDWLRERLSK